MTHYLLDTNHASALFKKLPMLRQKLKAAPSASYSLCRPSIGELWFMVFNSAQLQRNVADLDELMDEFACAEFDHAASVEFGRIKTELRKAGTSVQDVDVQIAAIARSTGMTLLTSNRHFNSVSLLTVEDWLKP